ncbi:hypothetical protein PFICI_14245 [Pestalotiopsis fici W106-1]|uniref:Uncharacterized protein n=1 Tax=Pestalotiopsis fici (strain W106-1 / CGMCC3.15140) TaxID=1229662 RepID=W3WKW3_PESFW|nr:uncharacterized protein PFICI_14245 [Pestalotiopsis fici W106-1]ETS74379.1 hypothetical protein PFICI_14245 [Pestalotiopsis fici W106-1]
MAIETVTIINNSGKIISNGKHLFGLFKEAKASYQEKKAAIKAERAIKRSNTYDVAAVPQYYDEVEYVRPAPGRRVSHDDVESHTSSRRSHRSRHSRRPEERSRSRGRSALTATNLEILSEVSSTAPSRAPAAYQSPYAETIPWEGAMSRPTMQHYPIAAPDYGQMVPAMPHQLVRSHTEPVVPTTKKKEKEIDMNLAYGNIPPDLASRVDLDPAYKAAAKEQHAHTLMERVEGLLIEAHCMHHTANHMIEHLKTRPEAAAAVALTLAELSTLLGKMSPSFLGAIKAGSPAVFALLASPQFLIAAGLTVGVTVVMFGGWKIVKRIKEAKEAEAAMAFEAQQAPPMHYPVGDLPMGRDHVLPYPPTEYSAEFDEALVLEEELSTIETWRRGIAPSGEDDYQSSADLELITPDAMRSQYNLDDAQSVRSARTTRTTKTHKSSKSHKSTRSSKSHHADDVSIPDRQSSRDFKDSQSEAGSERSHRSHRSSASKRSERTEKSSRRGTMLLEDGSKDRENTIDVVIRGKSKESMLKNMFKKKKKDDDEKSNRLESVLSFRTETRV